MRSTRLSTALHMARRLRALLEREQRATSPSNLRLLRLQLLLLKVQRRLIELLEPHTLRAMALVPVTVKAMYSPHSATLAVANSRRRPSCTC